MQHKNNIAFYGSHNAAIVVEQDGKILCVIEIERFLNLKNSGYAQYLICNTRRFLIKEILKWIKKTYNISEFENCYCGNTDTIEGEEMVHYEKLIPAKNYISELHHKCHASGAFYQTNYHNALIVSFDGGGNDGYFNIYVAKNRKNIEELERIDLDLGFPYMSFGEYFDDIKFEPSLTIGNLVYSGKIMGLCSYGNVIKEWLNPVKEYYLQKPNGENYRQLLSELGEKIDLKFDTNNRLKGHDAWDLAKTSQLAFEEIFLEKINPYLEEYKLIPLILTGGCALNIILNTRLKNELNREVFVPPNPNDCGMAAGLLLNFMKPDFAVDLTYKGIPVLDIDTLMQRLEEDYSSRELKISDVVNDLNAGRIVGVVRGTSEHGPRALGNRSIICDPTKENMKDILNEKVKNREWYRPFAPIVRLQDVSKYFEFEGESRWMSFCPKVKDEWKDVLKSITHVDGTARVQTVTRDQNAFMYDLLTEFEKVTGVGVLLNTSFNVDGKPILSTLNDAFFIFKKTQMDNLIVEDFYFTK